MTTKGHITRETEGWVQKSLVRVVGDGENMSFWFSKLEGEVRLCAKYPRLYLISEQKHCNLKEVGGWCGDAWRWNLV